MGIDYSLCSIHERSKCKNLLRDLSRILDAESRARIENLEWKPTSETIEPTAIGIPAVDSFGIADLALKKWERDNYVSLRLRFEIDEGLHAFLHRHNFANVEEFGHVWASIFAGKSYLCYD